MWQSGSLRIGRIGGIAIDIHLTFALIVGWWGWQGWLYYRSLQGVLYGILIILLLFACVLLHELGHGFQARALGLKVRQITLYPFGGLTQLDTPPAYPLHELALAAAGPLVNLGLAIGLAILLFSAAPYALDISNPSQWAYQMFVSPLLTPTMESILLYLLGTNLMLFFFNIIPAFPMDGGRVLRSGSALVADYQTATGIAVWVGRGIAAIFIFFGLVGWSPRQSVTPFLIVVALMILFGTRQEEIHVRRRRALVRVEVKDVIKQPGLTLSPWDTITPALLRHLSRNHHAHPVLVDGRVVGMVTLHDMQNQEQNATIAHVMRSKFPTMQLQDTLWVALQEMSAHQLATLPVTAQDGAFCGMIGLDDINQAWRYSPRTISGE